MAQQYVHTRWGFQPENRVAVPSESFTKENNRNNHPNHPITPLLWTSLSVSGSSKSSWFMAAVGRANTTFLCFKRPRQYPGTSAAWTIYIDIDFLAPLYSTGKAPNTARSEKAAPSVPLISPTPDPVSSGSESRRIFGVLYQWKLEAMPAARVNY